MLARCKSKQMLLKENGIKIGVIYDIVINLNLISRHTVFINQKDRTSLLKEPYTSKKNNYKKFINNTLDSFHKVERFLLMSKEMVATLACAWQEDIIRELDMVTSILCQ